MIRISAYKKGKKETLELKHRKKGTYDCFLYITKNKCYMSMKKCVFIYRFDK